MENASKALIIAGAILISILLIAVSVYIYNASQDTITGAGSSMNQQARDAYNSKFTSYVKDNASATDVRALIDNIISSNNENVNSMGKFVSIQHDVNADVAFSPKSDLTSDSKNKSHTATVSDAEITKADEGMDTYYIGVAGDNDNDDDTVSGAAAKMSKLKAKINSGKRYTVAATYASGLIVAISIHQQ